MVNNITFSKYDKITGINVGFPCCKNVTSSHFQYHQRTKCSGPPKNTNFMDLPKVVFLSIKDRCIQRDINLMTCSVPRDVLDAGRVVTTPLFPSFSIESRSH